MLRKAKRMETTENISDVKTLLAAIIPLKLVSGWIFSGKHQVVNAMYYYILSVISQRIIFVHDTFP